MIEFSTLIVLFISLTSLTIVLRFLRISDNIKAIFLLVLGFCGVFIMLSINITSIAQTWPPSSGFIIFSYGFYGFFYLKKLSFSDINFNRFKSSLIFFTGVSLLCLTLFVEYFYFDGQLGDLTTLILLYSILLIFYDFFPSNYNIEKNFTFLFFSLLIILFVFPLFFKSSLINSASRHSPPVGETP